MILFNPQNTLFYGYYCYYYPVFINENMEARLSNFPQAELGLTPFYLTQNPVLLVNPGVIILYGFQILHYSDCPPWMVPSLISVLKFIT